MNTKIERGEGLEEKIKKGAGSAPVIEMMNDLEKGGVLETIGKTARAIWIEEEAEFKTEIIVHYAPYSSQLKIILLEIGVWLDSDSQDSRMSVPRIKVTYGNNTIGNEKILEISGSKNFFSGKLPRNEEEKAVVKTAIKAAFINPEYSQRTKVCSPRIVKM